MKNSYSGESVARLVSAANKMLPLNGHGKCFYCGIGSKANEDGRHRDRDNAWDGDQDCLHGEYYRDLISALSEFPDLLKERD